MREQWKNVKLLVTFDSEVLSSNCPNISLDDSHKLSNTYAQIQEVQKQVNESKQFQKRQLNQWTQHKSDENKQFKIQWLRWVFGLASQRMDCVHLIDDGGSIGNRMCVLNQIKNSPTQRSSECLNQVWNATQ